MDIERIGAQPSAKGQKKKDGKLVDWMEQVSDEQFRLENKGH